LLKAFSASIVKIMWLLYFIQFTCCIMFINLHMLNHPCITGMKPIWSWFMIFLMCCWIWFTGIYWKFMHLGSSRILVCNFPFCHVLIWFWC
jgi:hypothetical protein